MIGLLTHIQREFPIKMVLFDSTSKLLCHNVESFECADCGANLPSMRELVEHQIEFWHDSEPIIVMKSSFESNIRHSDQTAVDIMLFFECFEFLDVKEKQ